MVSGLLCLTPPRGCHTNALPALQVTLPVGYSHSRVSAPGDRRRINTFPASTSKHSVSSGSLSSQNSPNHWNRCTCIRMRKSCSYVNPAYSTVSGRWGGVRDGSQRRGLTTSQRSWTHFFIDLAAWAALRPVLVNKGKVYSECNLAYGRTI